MKELADKDCTLVPPSVPKKFIAETVSLEIVWAAAYAAAYMRGGLNTRESVLAANGAMEDLLTVCPRGIGG